MFALLVALLARASRRCCVHARTFPPAVSTIDAMLWKVHAPFRPSRGAGRRRTPLVVRSSSSPSPACCQKNQMPGFLTTNSPGQALHDLAGGIQGAGRLPSGGEGGAEAKATLRRRLWKRQLRSHRSESAFGPGAGWHVQRCSSGREGGDGAPDAHGPSAEPPWWVWAGAGHERRRRVGLRMRCV